MIAVHHRTCSAMIMAEACLRASISAPISLAARSGVRGRAAHYGDARNAAKSDAKLEPRFTLHPSGHPNSTDRVDPKRYASSDIYEFRTKTARSGGSEKNSRRERISGLHECVEVRRLAREGPCLLGGCCGSRVATESCWEGAIGGGSGTGFQHSPRKLSHWIEAKRAGP